MVVRRKKKSRSLRGWRTHGWGRVGQHRKSGGRGGRGHAGFHKHMWTWVIKYAPGWYGKHGFTRPPAIKPEIRAINLKDLDSILDNLVEKGLVEIRDKKYYVDLTKLGYNKILGEGDISKPVILVTLKASKKAVKKVESAGGKVILLSEAST
ncbi:MAG: 50S ribosomal protein L15 [Thermoprotei archaeon]|nr:MAG: 50S ribosomal protein L15 [Thermoprotei archaeon]RLF01084.1 MAG: 50S ribosomal protein L15 [Thermoprotei archaeon]HDI74353.1 50S ribosomal protein L15 [Thermoprotei archaeon]